MWDHTLTHRKSSEGGRQKKKIKQKTAHGHNNRINSYQEADQTTCG